MSYILLCFLIPSSHDNQVVPQRSHVESVGRLRVSYQGAVITDTGVDFHPPFVISNFYNTFVWVSLSVGDYDHPLIAKSRFRKRLSQGVREECIHRGAKSLWRSVVPRRRWFWVSTLSEARGITDFVSQLSMRSRVRRLLFGIRRSPNSRQDLNTVMSTGKPPPDDLRNAAAVSLLSFSALFCHSERLSLLNSATTLPSDACGQVLLSSNGH